MRREGSEPRGRRKRDVATSPLPRTVRQVGPEPPMPPPLRTYGESRLGSWNLVHSVHTNGRVFGWEIGAEPIMHVA
jgi:hypothetical protein